ncbi:MAG: recombination protein RecO [Epsilonproteobacteria bacterium]|nr:recombination protein RecO [Campylobacterota bacterium]
MQGFIINLNRVKEEDLIVTIISKNSLDTLYRFYGSRHGTINIGFKIDYEKEPSTRSNIARLKDVIHIGYKWINDRNKLQLWQHFCSLFYPHLKELEELDPFYFDLLQNASEGWGKQNPKRVAVEAYIKLLQHEGRLHTEQTCFLCSNKIHNDPAFIRAYLPVHHTCSKTMPINKKGINELYNNNSSLFLSDKEIERLWNIMLEGL